MEARICCYLDYIIVGYRSCGSSANPPTDSDHKWSTSENDSQD